MFSTTVPQPTAKAGGLLLPDSKSRVNGVDWELGAPQGATDITRRTRTWKSRLNGTVVEVSEDDVVWSPVLTVPNIEFSSFTFSFDLAMRPIVSYRLNSSTDYKLYWYDTTIPGYTTITVPSVTSAFLTFDYPLDGSLAGAEVVWFYTNAGRCKYRRQSDRFTVEYDFGAIPSGLTRVTGAGLGRNWRMHVRFGR